MITVFIKKVEDLTETEKQNIMETLSDSAQARLNKKRNEALNLASLCALSLLTNEQRADLEYTESGRPFFKTLDADISISHSKTHSAVAISDSKNEKVGIDIEKIEPSPEGKGERKAMDEGSTIRTARFTRPIRFLTENERTALENGTPYLKIWTKKEALFKHVKSDDIPFIHLDSTTPEIYDAKFITVSFNGNVITTCTQKGTLLQIIEK